MSLIGNLEDLSLPDILQIVSLSRKSGVLMLEREGQQGKILIRHGRVIQTVSPRPGKTLGELLASRGLVGREDLEKALDIQRSGDNREILGAILVQLGLIDEATLEKVVQEQIEDAIAFFLSWREGTFCFELADIKGRGEFSVDPQAFILERGIDTQWLVMEGTRLVDERSRVRAASPPPGGSPAPPAPAAGGRALVLVDDDPVFRELAREHLGKLGFRVVACAEGAAGRRAVDREAGSGPLPAVAADLVMPTFDGRGFLGGLELLETLRRAHPEVPVVVVTAYPDEKVKAQVFGLGGQFLLKPWAGDAADVEAFFERLAATLAPPGGGAAGPAEAGAERLAPAGPPRSADRAAAPGRAAAGAAGAGERERTLEALAAADAALVRQEGAVASAGLTPVEEAQMREMLGELRGLRTASEIGLLILRLAAELLNRAVLFLVRGSTAVGLGGFGLEAGGGPDHRGIRGIAIALDEPSLLEEAVRRRVPVQRPLPQCPGDRTLLDQLGGQVPADAVALPLASGGRVHVVLYGDNLPEARPVAGARVLELFLSHAGLTLEKLLLEKKLQERRG